MAKSKELKTRIAKLQECIDIQCTDGTWNSNPYMHGMANGMIFAMSVLTEIEPEYLNAPEYFSCDIETLDNLAKSGIIVKRSDE